MRVNFDKQKVDQYSFYSIHFDEMTAKEFNTLRILIQALVNYKLPDDISNDLSLDNVMKMIKEEM